VCALLNRCPDVVALSEPLDVAAITAVRRPRRMVGAIAEWFDQARHDLATSGTATAKVLDGSLDTTNYALEQVDPNTGRRMRAGAERQSIGVDKQLGTDFYLAVKHPALFTALATQLNRQFQTVGIVRNPLALLASWSTVDMAIGRGHLPYAERADRRLRRQLRRIRSVVDRQLALIDWAFDKMAALDSRLVVRYEDVIISGGSALAAIAPSAGELDESLVSGNVAKHYDADIVAAFAERLQRSPGTYARWYPADEIEQLAQEYAHDRGDPGRAG
jgi:hypothetical protein